MRWEAAREEVARLFRPGFRARLIVLSLLASAASVASLLPKDFGVGVPFAAIGALAGLALVASIWPLGRVVAAVKGCEPSGPINDASRLAAAIEGIASRMGELRQSASGRHPATGLATREPYLRALGAALADPPASAILGVIRFVDYDSLATFDPSAASHALIAFAERLRASVASSRLVGQVDRDCFALWFDGAGDVSELQALGYVLSQDLDAAGSTLAPQIALGAARYPLDGEDPAVLLTRAETALAEPGRAADGRPAFFSPEASSTARRRFELGQEARRALQRNEFSLFYQPVVDIRQSRVVGAEALLRWIHPVKGPISPAEFVPMLEQSSLMEEVGLWVLNTACREARQWRDQGMADLRVAVNLSPVQCRHPQLGSVVMRTLQRHDLSPSQLELELTETAAMEDGETTRRLLTELKSLGVGVAIDDFGAGYSSLTYLKNLPFSKLKIDREFVTRVDERPDSQAICSALVALAKGLDIEVLAEGVERREELETLRSLGCPLIQGFYFSAPIAPADFVATVTDPDWLKLLASPVHRQRALIRSKGSA